TVRSVLEHDLAQLACGLARTATRRVDASAEVERTASAYGPLANRRFPCGRRQQPEQRTSPWKRPNLPEALPPLPTSSRSSARTPDNAPATARARPRSRRT